MPPDQESKINMELENVEKESTIAEISTPNGNYVNFTQGMDPPVGDSTSKNVGILKMIFMF